MIGKQLIEMKKTFSRVISLTAGLLVLCFSWAAPAFAKIPSPSRYYYVFDEANVLKLSTEDHIISVNEELSSKCGAQIVVACVKTTGGTEIADYAYKMFNQWKIGDKDRKNGVLVLLSVDDRDYYALQGKGLENLLSSGTLKLMLDQHLEPFFSVGDYDAGALTIFDELVTFLAEIYSVSVDVQTDAPENTTDALTTQSIEQWIVEALPEQDSSESDFDPFLFAENFVHGFPLFEIIKDFIKEITFMRIVIFIVVILLIRSLIRKRRRGGS